VKKTKNNNRKKKNEDIYLWEGGGAIATRRRRRWNDPIARREVLHCRAHRKHLSYTLISTDCRQRWPHWVYSFNSIYIRGIDWSCHHFDADILLFHFHTFHLYYSAPTHPPT
jgi:hypothetical protein